MNLFKGLRKSGVSIEDITNISKNAKNSAYNKKSNKIMVRFYDDLSFGDSEDIEGEIIHTKDISLILIERPLEACILYVEGVTYHNKSKDNELTINAVKDYPFGLDFRSDLVKHNGIEYRNNQYTIRLFNESQQKYYNKQYKFYIPILMDNIPIPIIRLDYADRILIPVDKDNVKRLSNISQVFLRQFIRLKLLERTGNKKDGIGWIAIFFIAIGMILMTLLNLIL